MLLLSPAFPQRGNLYDRANDATKLRLVLEVNKSLRPELGGGLPLYSPSFRERLSEKGSERGFDRRFGPYLNAKMGRKDHFSGP